MSLYWHMSIIQNMIFVDNFYNVGDIVGYYLLDVIEFYITSWIYLWTCKRLMIVEKTEKVCTSLVDGMQWWVWIVMGIVQFLFWCLIRLYFTCLWLFVLLHPTSHDDIDEKYYDIVSKVVLFNVCNSECKKWNVTPIVRIYNSENNIHNEDNLYLGIHQWLSARLK